MSDTMNDSPATRSVTDQDWRKLATYGTVTASALIFIALSNMPVALDDFELIADRFSLGDLSLYWLLFVVGLVVGKEVVLEGMAVHAKGVRDTVAGAIAGIIGGAGLSLLAILINNFDLRDPLINWSPQTLDKLSVGGSIGSGVVLWLVIGGVLGALGGSMHVLSARIRQLVTMSVMAVVLVAILETVLSDISESFGLEPLADIVYAKRGGLTIVGALIVAVIAVVYARWVHSPAKDAKKRFQALEGPERARGNLIAFAIVGASRKTRLRCGR